MFEFLTGFVGMFVALVLLSILVFVLIFGPVMPAINDVLNYGPITILILIVWLFFTRITIKCASGIAKAMTGGRQAHSGLLTALLVIVISLIPHGFGWFITSALIGEGGEYSSTMHQIVNTADIIICVAVVCIGCAAATQQPGEQATTEPRQDTIQATTTHEANIQTQKVKTQAETSTPQTPAEPAPEKEEPEHIPQALSHMRSIS